MNRAHVQVLLALVSLILFLLTLVGVTGEVEPVKVLAAAGLILAVAVLA